MCSGPMFQYQICNIEECPGPYEDFRAQQCAKRSSYYVHQNAKHSWIPYEPDDGEWGTQRGIAVGRFALCLCADLCTVYIGGPPSSRKSSWI